MSSTVVKALHILTLFADRVELSVTEASKELGITKSNASRLLATLEGQGWVGADPVTRRYRLGSQVLHLAAQYYERLDLRQLARPMLEQLRDLTGETAVLQVRMGDQRVCIDQVPSPNAVRRVVEVGEPFELTAGSSGKVLLAYMPVDEREELLSRLEQSGASTSHSGSFDGLRAELVKVVEQGFGESTNERVQGSCGIAAPVFDFRGRIVAAVGVSGPTPRWGPQLRRFAPVLMDSGRRLSELLGYVSDVVPATRV